MSYTNKLQSDFLQWIPKMKGCYQEWELQQITNGNDLPSKYWYKLRGSSFTDYNICWILQITATKTTDDAIIAIFVGHTHTHVCIHTSRISIMQCYLKTSINERYICIYLFYLYQCSCSICVATISAIMFLGGLTTPTCGVWGGISSTHIKDILCYHIWNCITHTNETDDPFDSKYTR